MVLDILYFRLLQIEGLIIWTFHTQMFYIYSAIKVEKMLRGERRSNLFFTIDHRNLSFHIGKNITASNDYEMTKSVLNPLIKTII